MKKSTKTKIISRFLWIFVALMGFAINGFAQNVTISPETGSLVAALTGGNEQGFENGWSALWRHEQLPLSFSVSDDDFLTEGGEIVNPAGNIREYTKNATVGNKLILAGGEESDLYMSPL